MNSKTEKTNTPPIKIESFADGAVIRFNRPVIKNPFSVETLEMLKAEFNRLENDEGVKRIVFTGSGDTFAAGANLNEIAELNGETARDFALRGQDLMRRIFNSSKETFAAIDGFCMGGALDLAVSCKKRIASERSVFAHPGVNLGIITGWGGTQMLPRLIGESRAMELFLTGKRIGADEALRFGLIDRIENNPLEFCVLKETEDTA